MSNILFKNAKLVLDGFASLQAGFDVLVKDKHIHTEALSLCVRGHKML
jgi:hypothetical protein